MVGYLALVLYVATILGANYAIGRLGQCPPPGTPAPCTIPVGFGLSAPSGVLFVGLALFLRDAVQDHLGRRWTVAGIAAGAMLSWWVAAPEVALASGAAFLLSEAADFLVYTPLRERHRPAAVLASGAVGSVVDSALFLWLAFGSLAFLAGQVLGKVEVSVLCALVVASLGKRRDVPDRQPA